MSSWFCLVTVTSTEGAFLFLGVLREVTTHFIVDSRALNKVGGNHVKVRIINPSGTNTDTYVTDKGDGTYRVEYTAFEDGEMLKCEDDNIQKVKRSQHRERHRTIMEPQIDVKWVA